MGSAPSGADQRQGQKRFAQSEGGQGTEPAAIHAPPPMPAEAAPPAPATVGNLNAGQPTRRDTAVRGARKSMGVTIMSDDEFIALSEKAWGRKLTRAEAGLEPFQSAYPAPSGALPSSLKEGAPCYGRPLCTKEGNSGFVPRVLLPLPARQGACSSSCRQDCLQRVPCQCRHEGAGSLARATRSRALASQLLNLPDFVATVICTSR